jgi:hypothetical protein
MMYIPLSLRQVEDLLFERGIGICHKISRFWWNRFGPVFAAENRKRRFHHRSYSCRRWRLGEIFARINGKTHYLWRAVAHEGEVLDAFATRRRDRKAALAFLKRAMKRLWPTLVGRSRPSSQQPRHFQESPVSRLGRMVSAGCLMAPVREILETGSHGIDSALVYINCSEPVSVERLAGYSGDWRNGASAHLYIFDRANFIM